MKNKTIQEKMAELNELVAWFDDDEFVLEQSIDKFKAAEKLAGEIRKDLEAIKNDVRVLSRKFDEEVE